MVRAAAVSLLVALGIGLTTNFPSASVTALETTKNLQLLQEPTAAVPTSVPTDAVEKAAALNTPSCEDGIGTSLSLDDMTTLNLVLERSTDLAVKAIEPLAACSGGFSFSPPSGSITLGTCSSAANLPDLISQIADVNDENWVTCIGVVVDSEGEKIELPIDELTLISSNDKAYKPNPTVTSLAPSSFARTEDGVLTSQQDGAILFLAGFQVNDADRAGPYLLSWDKSGNQILVEEVNELVSLMWLID
jgi:hypothetical protein